MNLQPLRYTRAICNCPRRVRPDLLGYCCRFLSPQKSLPMIAFGCFSEFLVIQAGERHQILGWIIAVKTWPLWVRSRPGRSPLHWVMPLIPVQNSIVVDRLQGIASRFHRPRADFRLVRVGNGDRVVQTVAKIEQFADAMEAGVLIGRLLVDPAFFGRPPPH